MRKGWRGLGQFTVTLGSFFLVTMCLGALFFCLWVFGYFVVSYGPSDASSLMDAIISAGSFNYREKLIWPILSYLSGGVAVYSLIMTLLLLKAPWTRKLSGVLAFTILFSSALLFAGWSLLTSLGGNDIKWFVGLFCVSFIFSSAAAA